MPLELRVPMTDLKPGDDVCQVNVIDELGRKFAFARNSLVVLAAGRQASN